MPPAPGVDYRGFIFASHDEYGLMLLHCTRKKNKPPHWQLPGGHIDDFEFEDAARQSDDTQTQLQIACKTGAVRELFEETGIDMREQLDRLKPTVLRKDVKVKDGVELLPNEYKHRLFYSLTVTDKDFLRNGVPAMGEHGKNLKIRKSVEHSGFRFEADKIQAAELLQLHSGGKVAEALRMSMGLPKQQEEDQQHDTNNKTTASINKTNEGGTSAPATTTKAQMDAPPVELPHRKEKKGQFCCFRC